MAENNERKNPSSEKEEEAAAAMKKVAKKKAARKKVAKKKASKKKAARKKVASKKLVEKGAAAGQAESAGRADGSVSSPTPTAGSVKQPAQVKHSSSQAPAGAAAIARAQGRSAVLAEPARTQETAKERSSMSSASTNAPSATGGSAMGFWFKTSVWIVIIIVGFMYVRHLANKESSPATEEKTTAQVVSEGATADSHEPAPTAGLVGSEAAPSSGTTAPEESGAGTVAAEQKTDTTPVAVVIVEEEVVSDPAHETGEVVVEKRVEAMIIEAVPEAPATEIADAASVEAPLPETASQAGPAPVHEAVPQPEPAMTASPAQAMPAPPVPMQTGAPAAVEQPSAMPQPVAAVPPAVTNKPAPQAAASVESAPMNLAPHSMPDTGSTPNQGFGYEPPFPPMPGPFGAARRADREQMGSDTAEYGHPRQWVPPRSYYRGETKGYPPAYYRGYEPRYPNAGYPRGQGWPPARTE